MADEYELGGVHTTATMDDSQIDPAVKRLRESLAATQKELYALHESFKFAGQGGEELTRHIRDLAAEEMRLKVQIDQAQSAAERQAGVMRAQAQASGLNSAAFRTNAIAISQYGTAMQQAGGAASGAGRGFLMLSQTVEDAQFGFQAIINNIPGLLMGFGMGAGLAGGVSLAAIAVNQLTKNMHGLSEILIGAHLKTPVQQMEELAKATKLTADEQARLNDLKREEAGFEAVKKQPGLKAEEQEKAFKAAVAGEPGQDVVDSLKAALQDSGGGAKMTPQERGLIRAGKAIDKLDQGEGNLGEWLSKKVAGALGFGTTAENTHEVQTRLDELDEASVRRMIGGAMNDLGPSGDLMRESLSKLMEDHPDRFPADLAAKIRGSYPEARQRKYEADLQAEQDAAVHAYDVAKGAEEANKGLDAQEGAAKAGDQVTEDAFARVRELRARDAERERGNAVKTDRFNQLRRIGMQLGGFDRPQEIRSSQQIASSSLTASVQASITNDNPTQKLLEEYRKNNLTLKELKDVCVALRDNLAQPFVANGGR